MFAELSLEIDERELLSPESVRRRLQPLDPPALVVLDELDRLEDDDALTALADTIKTLSDHAVASTLVLVGVARSIFTSGSIRDPLEAIAGRRIEIPAFSNHLSQFLEPQRGAVLPREGTSRRYFYRFADPILQPDVVLKGLATGLISDEQLRRFQPRNAPGDLAPRDFEASKPQSLF